ncbi:hypothetical protein SAMN02799624_05131 [Paenibacillus sp. UNC496MF]|uniref:GyrI-like domain-containing protein n=1 Tax=Paenibacillus sp. UNC496MF TaxID=1502753 RepID=UPI0008EABE98|nr:hypothetical protein [Paenibacillus sp. UNC496MF]SFJ58879.1 hypothetical protein SAMN02799624_05131 [Paenibacillus sp. UNC496MF]
MGAEIINVRKEHFPSLRFVGKRYTDKDRGADGGFGNKWNEWSQSGWFDVLEKLGPLEEVENGSLGFMGCSDNNAFEYWIGMFFPEQTAVPEGFASIDLPESDVGICWIKGRSDNGEIFGAEPHRMCMDKLAEHGLGQFRDNLKGNDRKWWHFFERYNCPRFTNKQPDGTVILDYGMYLGA